MEEFFNVIFFLEETEEEEEIIAATGTEFTRAAIIFTVVITKIVFERGSCVFGKSFKIILLCVCGIILTSLPRFFSQNSLRFPFFPQAAFGLTMKKRKRSLFSGGCRR